MSECVYCRQGSITMGVDGPVCPDCLEEGYGLAARNAALRTPVKVMSIGEMAEDRIEELEAKLETAKATLEQCEIMLYLRGHDEMATKPAPPSQN